MQAFSKGPGHLEIWPLNTDLVWPYRFLSRMASLLTSFVGHTLAKTRKFASLPQTNECLKWRLFFWPFFLGGTLPKMNKTRPKSGPVFFLATNTFHSREPEAPPPIIFCSWAQAPPCKCPALQPACLHGTRLLDVVVMPHRRHLAGRLCSVGNASDVQGDQRVHDRPLA